MLEWIISSAVLTAVVIVLRCILKGRMSLRLQYALWLLVLVRLLVPVSFGSTEMSVQNVVVRPATEQPQAAYPAENVMLNSIPISAPISADTDQTPVYHPQNPYAGNQNVRQSLPVTVPQTQPAQSTATIPPAEIAAEAPAAAEPLTVNEILNIVWGSGAGLVALWLLLTNLQFYRKLRRSRTPLEGEHAPLPVFVTDKIDTPCLFGLIRPKIYVTPEVAEDETSLRYSIEHEATHRRHGDHLWSLLRGLCLALHWYNPLVWIAAVMSRNDAELACDEATIRRIGEEHRAEYGRTLIQLTCEKRPALFVAATTMTGSGRGIKERIKLIVKKPKTAIYTLIAVVLIVAIAVGCTFTGAKTETEEPTTPTERTETAEPTTEPTTERAKLEPSDLPAIFDAIDSRETTVTYHGYYGRHGWEEIAYSAAAATHAERYLEELKQFTWEKYPSDDVEIDEHIADINARLIAPHATITFYGPARNCLVYVETDDAAGWLLPPTLKDDEEPSDYVAIFDLMMPWAEEAEATAFFGNEGRLLTSEELDYFSNYSANQIPETSGFSPRVGVENGSVVTLWGFLPPAVIDARDPYYKATLEKYGDGWQMVSFVNEGLPTEQKNKASAASLSAAVQELFASGDVSLTLYFADGSAWNTYTGEAAYLSPRIWNGMDAFRWTELNAPSFAAADYWLTAVSADGTKHMTFRADSAGTVKYSDGNGTSVWCSTPKYASGSSLAEIIKDCYDGYDTNVSRISFRLDGSAEDAAEYFVTTAFGEHMHSLEPGNGFGADDYEVIEWSVLEVSEDGKTVKGEFSCAFVPWHPESVDIRAGNTHEGTGKYAGKLVFYRRFSLQLQEDGSWRCVEFGTG